MKVQIELRLKELKSEFQSGRNMLAELDAKQADIRNTLVRISGAIQVLEELLDNEKTMVQTPDNDNEGTKLQKVATG